MPVAPLARIDRFIQFLFALGERDGINHGFWIRMHKERNAVACRQDRTGELRRRRTDDPMHRRLDPSVGVALQKIGNVDQDRSIQGWCWDKFILVPGIDFQSSDPILEQESAETKVRVWMDPRMSQLLDDLALDLGVVDQTELRVCTFGDGFEEVVAQVHHHRKAFEDVHRQGEALVVEAVERRLEVGQFRLRRTQFIAEAPMFIALLVVVDAFGTVGRVTLVDLGFGEFISQLLLERKREEGFALWELCQ